MKKSSFWHKPSFSFSKKNLYNSWEALGSKKVPKNIFADQKLISKFKSSYYYLVCKRKNLWKEGPFVKLLSIYFYFVKWIDGWSKEKMQ